MLQKNKQRGSMSLIGIGIIGLLLAIVFFMSYFTVEENERTVVTRWGEFARVAEPGLNFKVPVMHNTQTFRVDLLSMQPQKGVNCYTEDNQEIDVIFNVQYVVPPKNIEWIYKNAQDYRARLFDIVNDRLKVEVGKVNTQHVAQQRGKLRDDIKSIIVKDAEAVGIRIVDFQLTNIEYAPSFRKAVEGAAAAKATVETREQEKQQEIRVADRAREKAKGEADSLLLVARAQATALEIQNKALAQNRDVLDLRRIEVEMAKAGKWNGVLPVQMLSGITPFMQFQPPAGTPGGK